MTDLKAKISQQFGTPCPVIDLDIVEKNIQTAQSRCDAVGVANRPHIKTHKSPIIAQMQIDAGAMGITCQKVGEAAVMIDAGITDIVIATNVIGAARSGKLAEALARAPIKLCADNLVSLTEYAAAARSVDKIAKVLIEVDTGNQRAGVETVEEAITLARVIKDDPNLSFEGILYYPPLDGWPRTQTFHDELVPRLAEIGLSPNIVSTGGTPNFKNLGQLKGATEHRAGTCIYNDLMMLEADVASIEDCALSIYSTVVSRGGPDRGILDAGSKSLTTDSGGLEGHGLILEHPEARIHKFAEEHGFLDLSKCNHKPDVGDVVRVVPNHVCVVVNMFDQIVMVKNDEIVGVLPVVARGMVV